MARKLTNRKIYNEHCGETNTKKRSLPPLKNPFENSFMASLSMRKKIGTVASWLVRSSTDRAIWVRALAGDTALSSWAGQLKVSHCLSSQPGV